MTPTRRAERLVVSITFILLGFWSASLGSEFTPWLFMAMGTSLLAWLFIHESRSQR